MVREIFKKTAKESLPELKEYGRWVLSGVFSGVFLVIWVILQYFTGQILRRFLLSGIDLYVLWAFQILFAVLTLAPITVYGYKNIRVMWLRATFDIQQESLKHLVNRKSKKYVER